MQSSTTVALRVFVMLACAVGIPVLAMSGASWSEIVKKFQNLRWPAVVELASASTSARSPSSEGPAFASPGPSAGPRPLGAIPPAMPIPPPDAAGAATAPSSPATALAGRCEGLTEAPGSDRAASDWDDIPRRLQQLGATYYVLESWGNGQQLYRFYCKMAVTGNADYTHCFEATDADPHKAMQQVLREIESWRERMSNGR